MTQDMKTYPSPNRQHRYWLILLAGLLLGYISFVLWLKPRGIVLLSGGAIVCGAIAAWSHGNARSLRPSNPAAASLSWLDSEEFSRYLWQQELTVPDASQSLWRSVHQQATAAQQLALQIAQQEPTFIPDLIETLHTVIALVEQLTQTFQVTQRVQTPRYREQVQQRMQSSLTRLQSTHDQLQELRDQIAIESLDCQLPSAGISARLQALIIDNEKGMMGELE